MLNTESIWGSWIPKWVPAYQTHHKDVSPKALHLSFDDD